MDLETFVASTLTQIAKGIRKAQEEVAETDAWINPAGKLAVTPDALAIDVDTNARAYLEHIEFDVAVTISRDEGADAGGKITVLGLQLGSGGQVNYQNSTVSRVQFRVPVAWPPERREDLEKKFQEAAERRKNQQSHQIRQTYSGWMRR